jgi:hypothetical protein
MGRALRGLASAAVLVGSIGTVLVAARPVEAVGPGGMGYGVPRGPSTPSQKYGGAPTPSTLGRQNGQGGSSSSSSQSGPTTFGYWDGERFVRSPGPWAAPNNGSKVPDQRLR